jgi:hypothetical protein
MDEWMAQGFHVENARRLIAVVNDVMVYGAMRRLSIHLAAQVHITA